MSAKSRRQRRQAERQRRSSSLARAIRSACSACGSSAIRWLDAQGAVDQVGADFVSDALAWLGPDGGSETQFWACPDCGEAGAFGVAHAGWLDALDARTADAVARPPV